MHNRKIIAKGLAIGITISSLPSNSMANSINEYRMIEEEKTEDSSKYNKLENIIKSLFIKKSESSRVIEGKVLNITLGENDTIQDLTNNPDEYETIIVTTTEDRKLSIDDFNMLNKSIIPNIDLSNAKAESIPRNAFSGNVNLKTFKFPQGATTIDGHAFYNCINLTGNLIIPDGVTTIGDYAFYGCSNLNGTLIMPDGLTSIGGYAFCKCNKLTGDLVIPDSVTNLGGYAFYNCSKLTGGLVIPDGITTINIYTFGGCSSLNGNLVIPDSVTNINNHAFSGCKGLTGKLTIPENIVNIGNNAFDGCSGFTGDLIIPKGITIISNNAFKGCSGFNGKLVIPENVTSIGGYAFYRCSGFNGHLDIPETVVSIGGYAFCRCSGFNGSLSIPKGIKSIEDYAFYGCHGFTGDLIIPDGVISIGNYAFRESRAFNGNLVIPNSVTSIGSYAFDGCTGLSNSLVISDSITNIGDFAFSNTGIQKIIVKINENHIDMNYRKDIIEKLPLNNTYIEVSYNFDTTGTWLESTKYIKTKPSISTYIGTFENNEGIGIALDILEASDIKVMTILKDGIDYILEKDENGKYIFNESGNYQIYIETELGTTSNISFKNNSPILEPSINYDDGIVEIVNNGILYEKDGVVTTIDCDILEYRINGGDWQVYNGSFKLDYPFGTNIQVEVRAKHDGFISSTFSQEVIANSGIKYIENVIEEVEQSKSFEDISRIRSLINQLPECLIKEELQDRISSIFPDMTLERKNSSANLDIYIKSENMLSLSLDTNSVTFENYSGTEDMIKPSVINLTVNSSLPYKVNAYLESEIQSSNNSNIMDISLFNIKASNDSDFKEFTGINTPVVLLDDQPKGNGAIHSIDLKLKGSLAHKADVYKTTIKLEVTQK